MGAARRVIAAPGTQGSRRGRGSWGVAGWRGKSGLRPPPPPPPSPRPGSGGRGLLPATGAVPARSPPRPRPRLRLRPAPARPLLARPPARPLPRHEEAVGEEAFPGEGSGAGGARRAGRRLERPGGGRVAAAGPGEGAPEPSLPTPADKAASRARSRGSPAYVRPPPRAQGPRAPAPQPQHPRSPRPPGRPRSRPGVERPRVSVPPLASVQPLRVPGWLSPAPHSKPSIFRGSWKPRAGIRAELSAFH